MNNSYITQFVDDLDGWIVAAAQSGVRDFWQLVSLLPGVYPTVAREAVYRLIAESRIPEYVAVEQPPPFPHSDFDLEVPGLPVPHPLSSDWRFTKRTTEALLERVIISAGPTADAVLLGAPSVFFLAALERAPCRLILLDENPLLADYAPSSSFGSVIRGCDVRRDSVNTAPVKAVLADPPWYEDDVLGFLRAAAHVCADQGTVFLSFGSDGTRPGIAEERRRIIAMADKLGLRFAGIERLALSYATPFFEHNALRAAQLEHVPAVWRRGDLILFQGDGSVLPEEGNSPRRVRPWSEAKISGIQLRVRRRGRRTFADPRLIPLVPGEILPTVSRRDLRREAADVWTSGNRIYHCDGSDILAVILKAMEEGEDPSEVVQRSLQRPLSNHELTSVTETVAQVRAIVETECQEIRRISNGSI